MFFWTLFWVIDHMTRKWGSGSWQQFWSKCTEHLSAFGWRGWLIGSLMLLVIALFEGGFKYGIAIESQGDALKKECDAAHERILHLEKTSTTSGQWSELADRFKEVPDEIGAEWYLEGYDESKERFSFSGDSGKCCSLCRQAGVLLLRSPRVSASLATDVKNEEHPIVRWLKFISDKPDVFTGHRDVHVRMYSTEIGQCERLSTASISMLASVCERVCIDCMTDEL
jgi:hypothetical protein